MELLRFTEKEKWNQFINRTSSGRGAEFLQSWEWGELLKREGAEVLRVGIETAAAMIVKQPISKHYYWYAPRGPLGSVTDLSLLIKEIRGIDKKAVFLRIEPYKLLENKTPLNIKKTISLQPKKTLVLDLNLSEDELLSNMHQKTRYNIRLADKKGVEIKEGSAEDFSEFWRLMSLTGERDNFRIHGSNHYKNLLSADKNFIKLFFARYKGQNIAAGLFCFWGDQVTYLHGASDNKLRSLMAPYLLQWSVIKEAKEIGFRYYDFYGIDEEKWPGVTRFKQGFGGEVIEYPGTFDVVFKPFYYFIYNLLRRLKRGLAK